MTHDITTNCDCEDDDLLLAPTLADIIGRNAVTTNNRTCDYLRYGVCENDDALIAPVLNFTSDPPMPTRAGGGDIASYPFRGTKQAQPLADSDGDEQDDADARAGRCGDAPRPKGKKGRQAKPAGGENPHPQYDAPMAHEDRTDGQRGVVRTQGQSVYMADFLQGGHPLGPDYNGLSYLRSPNQGRDEARRTGIPTANILGSELPVYGDEDALVAPQLDYAQLSAENANRR